MNDEYGMGGMAKEYAKSGKMPKQLLEYFKRKNKEKEYAMGGAYKEYQGSGRASSSDYSDYRVFKEEGQPAQYFVRTDDGFSPAGTFRDLRAQLGDEGAANVISQFGLKQRCPTLVSLLATQALEKSLVEPLTPLLESLLVEKRS